MWQEMSAEVTPDGLMAYTTVGLVEQMWFSLEQGKHLLNPNLTVYLYTEILASKQISLYFYPTLFNHVQKVY